ncbi:MULTISPECIES: MFS transporter [Catenuloplanes]|uniref:MFS family permease n=1 Tax=Catenuloplanes niger TaxID=587534 RepID=A0AAE3ZL29_9ACTN|nr:MFS transporter [Catenuloplanes niger]MDR7320138.1 MFS family permease [Catenuloplanes niger]
MQSCGNKGEAVLDRFLILTELARLPAVPRLLVFTQLAFNVGFYLVLPFLADHLGAGLGLAAAVVGLVLGLRTFSQQGLFPLGGVLADRYGARPVVLAGCTVRIAGFLVLALAHDLATVLAGTVLVGVAAALFSPAVESALAREGARLEAAGTLRRTELFAMFSAAGEVGAVTGPLLGVLLLPAGFPAVCLAAAAVFALILAVHVRLLPAEPGAHADEPVPAGLREVAGNRRFLAFAAANSAGLFAYHQLYLALPLELRAEGAAWALGWLFALASVLMIAGQLTVARHARRLLGPRAALASGFALMAVAFAVVPVLPGAWSALAMVVLLTAGQMLASPVARDTAARLAGERRLGAHLGVLSAAGGLAVLAGSTVTGALLDSAGPVVPWLVLATVPLVGALLLLIVVPAIRPPARVSGPRAALAAGSEGGHHEPGPGGTAPKPDRAAPGARPC